MAYKVFSNGDALTGSELNTYLMNQSVMVFASTTARDAALTAPTEGMVVWLQDANKYVYYNGSGAWADLITPASSGNAIINGAFDIWQRGTSFSSAGYTADRWQPYLAQAGKLVSSQSTNAPAGFKYSYLTTSSSAYTPLSTEYFMQTTRIEGYNAASFAFGTSSAKTLTLSFWVRSSLTGTFGGALHNNAFDRSYVFSYTISSANTWEYKTVTIAGDTSGTWDITTNVGLEVGFSMGAHSGVLTTAGSWVSGAYWGVTGQVNVISTSGATWQVTGVQLEAGSVATPFKRNASSIQGELAACQRYYQRQSVSAYSYLPGIGSANSTSAALIEYPTPVSMRVTPTAIEWSGVALWDGVTQYSLTSLAVLSSQTTNSVKIQTGGGSGMTQYRTYHILSNATAFIGLTAEL